MSRLPVVILLVAALTNGGCVRECRCVVTVAPDAEGCLVVAAEEVTTVAVADDDPLVSEETLDALATVGKAALDVALALIF